MIKYLLTLQFKRLKRKIIEWGVNPIFGFIIVLFLFVFLSKYLFLLSPYAEYFYTILGLITVWGLSERKRNDFLKSICKKKEYSLIRWIENLTVIFPFLCYLFYEESYLFILILSASSVVLSTISMARNWDFAIPTPFKKIPFEYIIGFRKTIVGFLVVYFVLIQAILFDNFNLGVFILGAIFLISMSYYLKTEKAYFAWIYNVSPKRFLAKKIFTGLICTTILAMPSLIALCFSFRDRLGIILAVYVIGCLALSTIILAKYSSFPNEMGLTQFILLGVGLSFPPIFLAIIPMFYVRSVNRLNSVLSDKN